jgi:hypothetical protein
VTEGAAVTGLQVRPTDLTRLGAVAAEAAAVCARARVTFCDTGHLLAEARNHGPGRADPGASLAMTLQLLARLDHAFTTWAVRADSAAGRYAETETALADALAAANEPHRHHHGFWSELGSLATEIVQQSLTLLAPYVDDLGRLAHQTVLLAALANGLPAALGQSFAHAPGLLALLAARHAPEGPGWAAPAGALPGGDLAAGSVAGWLARVAAVPDGCLAVARLGTSAGPAYAVLLPGIHSLLDTRDPLDLYGAVLGLFGHTSAYSRAVQQALSQAGVPRGARLLLVGHSQGGIAAMDLAGDPRFNGGRYRVTHVLAAGSPISALHPAPRSGTRVLELDNDADLVPQLDLRDSRLGPGGNGDDRDVVVFRRDHGTVGGNHGLLSAYAPFAGSPAFLDDPRTRAWLAGASDYLQPGPAATQVFTLRDRPP